MMDATTIPANTVSFRDYLFKDKRNRTILILAAVAMVIQFGVFKWFYPFASFIHGDSFVYIRIASLNSDVDMYLVGYGKFLRLFNFFTYSDTALVTFQYLLIQSSALIFLFTIFYFYNCNKIIRIIILAFMVLNPLFLYLANMVSSDGVFLAVSFIWFTTLLWLIYRPSTKLILLHSLFIFIAFTLRYNALIYPVITAIALIFSKQIWQRKTLTVFTCIMPCVLFMIYSGNKYKELTGTWQASPFSGWQLANNAMYAYRYVDKKNRKPVPPEYKPLDRMVTDYFDSTRDLIKYPTEGLQASTFYMWHPTMPLQRYMNRLYINNPADEVKKWASMGPLYKGYGLFLIKQYPAYYAKYFILPNTGKYLMPPGEYLEVYNTASHYVATVAQQWFGYKSTKVYTRTKTLDINILNFYPVLSSLANITFVCCCVCFVALNGLKQRNYIRQGILLASLVWFVNLVFSILSTAAALRFLSFPLLLTTTFTVILLEWMWASAQVNKPQYESKQLAIEAF
jgi:hypothetical protein